MKIRYLEKQLEQECQLVTVINAARHLGLPTPELGDDEYMRLKELVGAVAGTAISIEKAHAPLGVLAVDIIPFEFSKIRQTVKKGFPVSVSVWAKRTGFHNVLIIDYRFGFYRLVNARKITKTGWVSGLRLQRLMKKGHLPNVGPTYGALRIFHKRYAP